MVITLQSVGLQPPVGYVQTKHPKSDVYEAAGLKVYLWQKKSTDPVSPSLTVTILPAIKEAWQADEFVSGFVESMSREWQHSSTSEIMKGHVGSADAVQLRYSGTTMAEDRVSGFVLAFNDVQGTVIVNAMAPAGAEKIDLEILRSSAMTCRGIKGGR